MILPAPAASPSLRSYHGRRGRWSSSRAKVFVKDPGRAFGTWVADPPIYRGSPPSPQQTIGSAVHDLLAKAGGRESTIYPVKTGSRNSTAWRDAWAAYPDKLVLTAKEHDDARRIADAILEPRTKSAEVAKALLTGEGFSEYYHAWDERVEDGEELVVPCQQLVDRLALVGGRPAVGEVKSFGLELSPEKAFWQMRDLGYDDQMAFNLRGIQRALGLDEEPIGYWIVVSTQPSYPVLVVPTVSTDPETGITSDEPLGGTRGRRGRQSARDELDVTLARLAECLKDPTGVSWTHPWERLESGLLPVLGGH